MIHRVLLALLLAMIPVTLCAATLQLSETGQTACWDSLGAAVSCNDTGQDGEIRAGLSWPAPRFTTHPDQTVTDNLTGLVWSRNADAPGPAACTPGEQRTWQQALDYIDCLNANSYLGHADWRLPNRTELGSLINIQQTIAYTWLNGQGFTGVENSGYWTSSSYATSPSSAYSVNMNGSNISGYPKNSLRSVWPVRGGQTGSLPVTGQTACWDSLGAVISCAGTGQDGEIRAGQTWPVTRFVVNGNQTVTDNLTGLVWSQNGNAPGPAACTPGVQKTWQEALDYIACLNSNNYLNHRDWRLPNRIEHETLLNAQQADNYTWLGNLGFASVMNGLYWTSSSKAKAPAEAWVYYMIDGCVDPDSKSGNKYVWPVFGGEADFDGDGVTVTDNCLYIANGDQADNDGDSTGDVCDEDDDNDGINDIIDRTPMTPGYFPAVVGSLLSATFNGELSVDAPGTRGETVNCAVGDQLAIFDHAGTLCGQATLAADGNYLITVYGDDPSTTGVDEGASDGEELTVRFWDQQHQLELPVRTLNLGGQRQTVTWSDNGGDIVKLHALHQQQIGVYRKLASGGGNWHADADGTGTWGGLDFTLANFGLATDKVAAGDWNGDGLLDPGTFRNKNGLGWWYFDSNGNGVWDTGIDQALQFGIGADIPVVGDWNGDGVSDFGVFRNVNGLGWWYFDSNGNRRWDPGIDQALQFGIGSDIPVVGDWNGDGRSDFGVFRNKDGLGWWYFDSNGNRQWDKSIDQALQFGLPGDLPVAGDWNGDVMSDFGVMRNGVWYLDGNGDRAWNRNTDLIFLNFGIPGDQPVAGIWK